MNRWAANWRVFVSSTTPPTKSSTSPFLRPAEFEVFVYADVSRRSDTFVSLNLKIIVIVEN